MINEPTPEAKLQCPKCGNLNLTDGKCVPCTTIVGIKWIITDNAGHDVLAYEVDNPERRKRLSLDPGEPLIGVTFYTETFEQREAICRLVEKWNSNL